MSRSPAFGRVRPPPPPAFEIDLSLARSSFRSSALRTGGAVLWAAHGLGDVAERRGVAAAVGL
jgi:hypothetical protein